MINKEVAVIIKKRALAAISELDAGFAEIKLKCSKDDQELLRRKVGFSIIKIIDDLLEPVYLQFPELDDDRKSNDG